MRYIVVFFFLFLVLAGGTQASPSPAEDSSLLSCKQQAARMLKEAMDIMQKNYYKKSSISWDSLRVAAIERVAQAGSCEESYQSITWCLAQLDEKHSYLMPSARAVVYNNDTANLKKRPALRQLTGEIKTELIDNDIAYISIPWISTTDPATCTMLADSIQQLIAHLDEHGISKWIVDLRKNTGGNCWPMLAGIGPLLGDGICGYFVSDSTKVPISYKNGEACHGRYTRCQTTNGGYRTKVEHKNIVVLTGARTSSAGELLALAFKGKNQTYLYGEPTAGLTTGNATYTLSDHSMLVLTVCFQADRTGKIFSGKIMPDEYISTENAGRYEDPVKGQAIMWLQSF